MKTKKEKSAKKIQFNKLKIAVLSRNQKNQVLGGSLMSLTRICANDPY